MCERVPSVCDEGNPSLAACDDFLLYFYQVLHSRDTPRSESISFPEMPIPLLILPVLPVNWADWRVLHVDSIAAVGLMLSDSVDGHL